MSACTRARTHRGAQVPLSAPIYIFWSSVFLDSQSIRTSDNGAFPCAPSNRKALSNCQASPETWRIVGAKKSSSTRVHCKSLPKQDTPEGFRVSCLHSAVESGRTGKDHSCSVRASGSRGGYPLLPKEDRLIDTQPGKTSSQEREQRTFTLGREFHDSIALVLGLSHYNGPEDHRSLIHTSAQRKWTGNILVSLASL